jgi:urea transport system substrate-binding protein
MWTVVAVAVALLAAPLWRPAAEPIRFGVVLAQTGPLASTEKPLAIGVQLAVKQINDQGGLLGRRVEVLLRDSASRPEQAASQARQLIDENGVSALLGCWAVDCRDAVKTVVQDRGSLLVSASPDEGMGASRELIYTGPTLNQQILPAVAWALQRFGSRIYVVGAEDGLSRTARIVLRDLIHLQGGELLGERNLPAGSRDVAPVLADLRALKPDLVVNLLLGDSNRALFDALVASEWRGQPVLSPVLADPRDHGAGRLDRHFVAAAFSTGQAGPANEAFQTALAAYAGASAPATDGLVAAYVGVRLWAAAVRDVGTADAAAVGHVLPQQSVTAPYGIAALDGPTRRLWRPLRVSQVRPDGSLTEMFASAHELRPSPWPAYRSHIEWARRLEAQP